MIKAKRFWSAVNVRAEGTGFEIKLDERALKTPGGHPLILPSLALAEAIAGEWAAVDGEIRPATMPMTRLANTAAERVPTHRADLQNQILEYLENDALRFRAPEPPALIEAERAWDAPLNWARSKGIALSTTTTLQIEPADENSLDRARKILAHQNDYETVAFHEFTIITASFVLALAIFEGEITAEKGFDLSRIESDFQSQIWGEVEEKQKERAETLAQILTAEQFLSLIRAAS